jgi:hypothetical protein
MVPAAQSVSLCRMPMNAVKTRSANAKKRLSSRQKVLGAAGIA